jgi:hypothetical protein
MVGRVTNKPTEQSRQLVEKLAAYGVKRTEIAMELDISEDTLVRHYRVELELGTARVTEKIATRLAAIALQEDDLRAALPACIFWLKTRAGWRETLHVNHSTEPEKVITDEATPEEWENEWADKSAASQAH